MELMSKIYSTFVDIEITKEGKYYTIKEIWKDDIKNPNNKQPGYLAIKGISAIKCRNGKCVIYDENIKRKDLKDWFSKKGIVRLNEYARNNLLEETP